MNFSQRSVTAQPRPVVKGLNLLGREGDTGTGAGVTPPATGTTPGACATTPNGPGQVGCLNGAPIGPNGQTPNGPNDPNCNPNRVPAPGGGATPEELAAAAAAEVNCGSGSGDSGGSGSGGDAGQEEPRWSSVIIDPVPDTIGMVQYRNDGCSYIDLATADPASYSLLQGYIVDPNGDSQVIMAQLNEEHELYAGAITPYAAGFRQYDCLGGVQGGLIKINGVYYPVAITGGDSVSNYLIQGWLPVNVMPDSLGRGSLIAITSLGLQCRCGMGSSSEYLGSINDEVLGRRYLGDDPQYRSRMGYRYPSEYAVTNNEGVPGLPYLNRNSQAEFEGRGSNKGYQAKKSVTKNYVSSTGSLPVRNLMGVANEGRAGATKQKDKTIESAPVVIKRYSDSKNGNQRVRLEFRSPISRAGKVLKVGLTSAAQNETMKMTLSSDNLNVADLNITSNPTTVTVSALTDNGNWSTLFSAQV